MTYPWPFKKTYGRVTLSCSATRSAKVQKTNRVQNQGIATWWYIVKPWAIRIVYNAQVNFLFYPFLTFFYLIYE